ncbi:hypothetical protein ACN2C7_10180 [Caulobacter sp. ErkDOM-E]|uniref:hypothetical protein n=1 Tax=Caulobacter sp. ErkDOM-E TaxID=3402778 RepID=UPI003AF6E70F
MPSFQSLMYQIGLNSIERAKKDAIGGFKAELARLEEEWREHKRKVAAGLIPDVEGDEETGYVFDFGEHIGEMQFEAEQCLKLVREAFLLTVYHYWEKEACGLLGISHYKQSEVFEAARVDKRFDVDEAGLNKARQIANCIKHDVGKALFKAHPELFDMEHKDPEDKSNWQRALALTDEYLDGAIKVVRSSGPRDSK